MTFIGDTLGKVLKKAVFRGVAQKNPPLSYSDILGLGLPWSEHPNAHPIQCSARP